MVRLWSIVDRAIPEVMLEGGAEARRVARMVVLFSIALGINGPLFALILAFLGAPVLSVIILIGASLVVLAPLTQRVLRSQIIAVNQIVAGLVWVLTMVGARTEGHLSPTILWFTAVPALSMLLLGTRWALAWTLISISIMSGLVAAALSGGSFHTDLTTTNQLIFWLTTPIAIVALHFVLVAVFEAAKVQMATELEASRSLAERAQQAAEEAQGLAERAHRDARIVLDSVQQGLFLVDRQGLVVGERSAAIDRWLGRPAPGRTVWDWLGTVDPRLAEYYEMGWDDLQMGLMPVEVVLEQLSQRLEVEGRALRLTVRPIVGPAGDWARALVVATDITEAEAAAHADRVRTETFAILERVSADRQGFLDFLREARRILGEIVEPRTSSVEVLRGLHTLKGNASFFGLHELARHCHALETQLAEERRTMTAPDAAGLAEVWEETSSRIVRMVGEEDQVHVARAELAALAEGVDAGLSNEEVGAQLRRWTWEPTATSLERLGGQAKALAARLGRGTIEVVCEDDGIYLDSTRWSAFWAGLAHVVRNAVDHGLEPPEERRLHGKPDSGRLTFEARRVDGLLYIAVTDDGAGIAWDRVAERARTAGLPHATQDDLVEALFADGLSTTETVSQVSGRGVGLASCREVARELGAELHVRSTPGNGTTIGFWFAVEGLGVWFDERAAA